MPAELHQTQDEIIGGDGRNWTKLKDVRALVKLADENGWSDDCLVSAQVRGGHPGLREWWSTKALMVQGPT